MIKKLFLALAVVLMATTAVAQTTLGESCENPIPVDKNYEGVITEPGEYWFTAWSYDLPLNVHFTPDNANSVMSPEVYVDFTCTPGVYEDHKLDSVINGITSFGLELPVEFACSKIIREGKVEWDLSIGSNYRDNLTECGITYNVQAMVNVYFPETGKISLKPDTTFTSCMDNSEYVTLGQTFDIMANDSDRVFVLPYSEWKKDSVQFAWEGDGSATVWVASLECEFYPSYGSGFVWAGYEITSSKPHVLSISDVSDAIKNHDGGGVFFAKVLSANSGKLTIQKAPLSPIQGGATLLEYGKTVEVADSNQLFCFPRTWKDAVEFVSSTNYVMEMYAGNNIEFATSAADTKVLAYYSFFLDNNSRKLQLSYKDLVQLISKATGDYIYVRFKCNKPTTLTPLVWTPLSCASQSIFLFSGRSIDVPKKSQDLLYRLRYEDWKGYEMSLDWWANSALPVYIADTCEFTISSSDANVLKYLSVKKKTVQVISADDVNSWAEGVDSEGFIYVRFNPSADGTLVVTSSRPEPAPEPESPCVANSIELKAGDQITLNLDSAFTIYRINYAEWVAKDTKLAWAGESPLHTFVAETCEFAVAPYNRYVVNYAVVPANGEYVLDAATLSKYADKVDADGYLYIRFLTEKQGTLSVTSY
ncbi:MAG: hypothetical protein J6R43_02185 [Paludibacteraceae bacterium]|nr:hypothetical protein [Paludibacteraceae bacterium]